MDIQELWDKFSDLKAKKDFAGIKSCLEELVDKGEHDALSLIGDLYAYGESVEQDTKKALEYYNLALEHGCKKANIHIAELYYYGLGVKQDYKKAFELFKLVAENEIPFGNYKMASMYLNGEYVEKNYAKALENGLFAKENGIEKASKIIHKIEGLKLACENGEISRVLLQKKLFIGYPVASETFEWLLEKAYIDKDGKTIITKEEYEKLFNGN